MKKIVCILISLLDRVIPKNPARCVFASFPDFSDNAYALYEFMQTNSPSAWTFVWLVEDLDSAKKKCPEDVRVFSHRVQMIPKQSLRGIWNYLRARYVFFTHGLYNGVSIPENHIVVNLWHGMPLKSICHLDPGRTRTVPRSTFCIATSPLFADIMARAFGLPRNRVLITGLPRNDALFEASGPLVLGGMDLTEEYDRILMWMPTYRQSCTGEVRTDGRTSEFIPLVAPRDLDRLDALFRQHRCYCIVKLHPMDIHTSLPLSRFSNIAVLDAADFDAQGLCLYQALAKADMLLTDYSSVFIDFLLLDRPMLFLVPDMDRYQRSRGFVFEDAQTWLAGEHVDNVDDLYVRLEHFLRTGEDSFKGERARLKNQVHKVQREFCRTLYDRIFQTPSRHQDL